MWCVNVDNTVISKLVKTKTNSKYYLIEYVDKALRLLVLIMPKMSGQINTFKIEYKINKLTFSHVDDEELLENYKSVGTKIKILKRFNQTLYHFMITDI